MRSLLAGLCVLLGGAATASPGLLDQPQTFPWTAGLTPVVQDEAGGLEPGGVRLKAHILWFNTYRQFGTGELQSQEIDMEGGLLSVSGAWSFAQGWELRAHAEGWLLGGGILDPLLSGFHGLIRVPNQGRDGVSDFHYRNYLAGYFDDTSASAGLTQLSSGVRAFTGPWSWNAWIKAPAVDRSGWGWTSKWGAGSGIGWGDRWPVGTWGLSFRYGLSASLIAIQSDSGFPGQTGWLTAQSGGYAVAEWTKGPRVLVQATWTKVPRHGEGYLAQGAGLLTTGFQIPLDEGWTLEGSWTEEFLTWATNETGFGAGVVWTP